MDSSLLLPAFIAGILTFLAPCTLPLVPGYLGFISGISAQELQKPSPTFEVRKRIFINGLMYVLGFSVVFIAFGTLLAFGRSFIAQYRELLSQIGGIFIIFFGLYMMHFFQLPFFAFMERDKHINPAQTITPGKPLSSLIFGATFAFGWTPCVGPILGSILLLASSVETILQGAGLLAVFSLGLGLPFLLIALSIGSAFHYIPKIASYSKYISFVGGLFLVTMGIMLVTNSFGYWLNFFNDTFDVVNTDWLLNYL